MAVIKGLERATVDPVVGDAMLDHLRFRAEVDYIILQITLQRASHVSALRRALGIPYVRPVDPGLGGAAHTFKLTINNPESWARVTALVRRLDGTHGVVVPVRVVKMEISLDAYAAEGHADLLPHMVARFFRFSARHCATDSRTATHKGSGTGAALAVPDSLLRRIREGKTLYIGGKRDDRMQRFYLKTTDRKVTLPQHEHRARMELTLQGGALPVETLQEAESFELQRLRDWFMFRRLRDNHAEQPVVVQVLAERAGVLGTREKRPGRVLYHRLTCADTRLNRRAYDALRGLTTRMGHAEMSELTSAPVPLKSPPSPYNYIQQGRDCPDDAAGRPAEVGTRSTAQVGAVPDAAAVCRHSDQVDVAALGDAEDNRGNSTGVVVGLIANHERDGLLSVDVRQSCRHLDDVASLEAPELHQDACPAGLPELDAVHQGDLGAGREERLSDLEAVELIQQVLDGFRDVDRLDHHGEVPVPSVGVDGAVREVPDEIHFWSRS